MNIDPERLSYIEDLLDSGSPKVESIDLDELTAVIEATMPKIEHPHGLSFSEQDKALFRVLRANAAMDGRLMAMDPKWDRNQHRAAASEDTQ